MKKIVTFGELLLRLSASGYQRLFQEKYLNATFCGAEANVAVCLQQLGQDATFITVVPDNAVGDAAIADLRYYGVDVTEVIHKGERLGLFYLEKGASQRASTVIYDRKHSAFSQSTPDEYNWDSIFNEAKWFHFSGINPALSRNVDDICFSALKKAKEHSLNVSCDINYRSTLWDRKQAEESLNRLMPYVDVCIANEEDIERVFGIECCNTDIASGKINKAGYEDVGRKIYHRFGCKYVAFTLRESITANDNRWSGVIYDAKTDKAIFSKKTYMIHIVDRVGSGDSFAGGLIYALSNGYGSQEAIDFATATSCLKHTIEGDYCRISIKEVKSLLSSAGSGRIER